MDLPSFFSHIVSPFPFVRHHRLWVDGCRSAAAPPYRERFAAGGNAAWSRLRPSCVDFQGFGRANPFGGDASYDVSKTGALVYVPPSSGWKFGEFSLAGGNFDIWRRRADLSGPAEVVLEADGAQMSWSITGGRADIYSPKSFKVP